MGLVLKTHKEKSWESQFGFPIGPTNPNKCYKLVKHYYECQKTQKTYIKMIREEKCPIRKQSLI